MESNLRSQKKQTRSGQSLTTRTCELHSLELPLHVFAHQDDLLFSPVALQLLLKPWRQLQLVTGWFYHTRREDFTWNDFTIHPSIHDPWDGNAPEHNNVNIVHSSPAVKAELDRRLWGLNTMKSCLVPPNLKKPGVKPLANVRNFGELEKANAEQMCQQQVGM